MGREAAQLSVRLQQAGPIPLDVALSCPPGELLAIVGPSGSGKTTVLRSISGLYRPLSGLVRVDEETWLDTESGIDLPPQTRSVGLVFQDYALFPHLSALDNVRLAMSRIDEPRRSENATQLLARVHLAGLEARRPDQLSGGQRQRVALARALARDPKVLLLDEPFSAVDRMTREPLKEEIAALHRGLDIPMLLVTHDLEEALSLADRICVLNAGMTLQIGTPDEVRLRPKSALVARLMGHTNLFEVAVLPGNRIRWGNGELHVSAMNGCSPGPRVTALVPPDAIVLAAADAAARNVVNGIVTELKPLGETSALTVVVDGQRLRLRVSAREASSRNTRIG
ncbi:MAG: ABC transporter ATP-binding protein, partial [Hyphomicrobium sp.]|nr:ABC transporter ATP-binding protein [Hyphomicrobium sp.]